MSSNYLKAFVVGSTFLVLAPFYYKVSSLSNQIKNYSYKDYTLIAPIYLGIMNMLSLLLARTFNLSWNERFFYIGILSPLIVIMIVKYLESYNFSNEEWKQYYIILIAKHFIIFNVVVKFIETNI